MESVESSASTELSQDATPDHSDNADPVDAWKEPKIIAMDETVGNMSISPTNRDLALAARNGLYIVDLENTRATPRFLPQGGTWEVADVQWNPHPSSCELIVSASNQKLLIWNLKLAGYSSIQHILHGHFRAVTDINWHPQYESIVASTSIDGWSMIWDVRDRTKKDVLRMTTWTDAGTQVKWNRKDPHILASAHRGHIHIWDDRKGAVPLSTVYAHDAKIYGIDWSRYTSNELVTCSLDSSIRRFSVADRSIDPLTNLSKPLSTIQTSQPIWRARHLPFGHGVLSLPQRGSHTLEMYAFGKEQLPVADFERSALVKEYVWRTRGGDDLSFDDREFQLITLATDRTVKMEYISPSVLESTGHVRGSPIQVTITRRGAKSVTYRDPPRASELDNADLDDRLVTASTRRVIIGSNPNGTPSLLTNPYQRFAITASASSSPTGVVTGGPTDITNTTSPSSQGTPTATGTLIPSTTLPAASTRRRNMTLAPKHRSKANKRRGVDQLSWFSSVKLDRERSLGPPEFDFDDDLDGLSQTEGDISGSRSRPTSRAPSQSGSRWSGRSGSKIRSGEGRSGRSGRARGGNGSGTGRSTSGSPTPEDERDLEPPQDLAEEVSRVVRKLVGKVSHEKTETSKNKKCTFTLHGPWGEDSEPTFIRVTFFNFPPHYPRPAPFSRLTKPRPSVEIEKGSTDLPSRTRYTLTRRLRQILGREPPVLELCLLYLLGRYDPSNEVNEGVDGGIEVSTWGYDDDDDDALMPGTSGNKNLPFALLLDHHTLPKARHTQAIFGPTGELVYLCKQAVKVIPQPTRASSPTDSIDSPKFGQEIVPSTSGTLLDAMWGLSKLSTDAAFIKRDYVDIGRPRRATFTDNIIMTPFVRTNSLALPPPPPLTSVQILDTTGLGSTIDLSLAQCYQLIIPQSRFSLFCMDSATTATDVGRPDHARVWLLLDSVLSRVLAFTKESEMNGLDLNGAGTMPRWKSRALAQRDLIETFQLVYNNLASQKDIQMLAMLSIFLLNLEKALPKHLFTPPRSLKQESTLTQHFPSLRLQLDFHSHRLAIPAVYAPASKLFTPRPTSSTRTPVQPQAQAIHPSPPTPSSGVSSSKASWSSIISATSYRNLLGSSGSRKGKASSPAESKRTSTIDEMALANGSITPELAAAIAELRRRRTIKVDAVSVKTVDYGSGPSMHTKSRSDSQSHSLPMRIKHNSTVGLPAFRRGRMSSLSQFTPSTAKMPSKPAKIHASFYDPPIKELTLVTAQLRIQCEGHIRAYAEVLRQHGLMTKRVEVLKNTRQWDIDKEDSLTVISLCKTCGRTAHPRGVKCRSVKTIGGTLEPRCVLCTLPIKRIGRTCLRCTHVTHYSCLEKLPPNIRARCPSGCGCHCGTLGGTFELDKNPPRRERHPAHYRLFGYYRR